MIERSDTDTQMRNTLEALTDLGLPVMWIYPNSDLGFKRILAIIEENKRTAGLTVLQNVERQDYLTLLANAAVLVGNSSSGILEAPSFNVPVVNIGTRLPAHGTVLGRQFLADLTEDELAALYPRGELDAFSDQTPPSLAALKETLDADRARGYAISQSYYERGVAAIAAPVRDETGRVVAALNITYQDGVVSKDEIEGPLLSAA